ncbi:MULTISPECIES: phosphoethanolamine transferase [Photorhabdus]|uniref:Glucan phosphoethanolaminetransferase (Alkaline phosphatase superfamily) n=2 Tax=Photorhabdus asymbiotica TaxID=291112 RepID=A0ABX9SSG4_9GAMM|nr:phosphoethanolamine transferase [Photorhabdus asymbiotica]RKS66403.1 glucan phosphoethanolaminetransferase (alkaline phosphatase superfamily) [Photorhabdus asymbiotica]CAQ83679.1 similar to probable membrane protein ybip of escherichia coli [Photorhabdus asymbiotica]
MKATKNHLIKLLPVAALFIFCLLVHIALGYRLKIGYVLAVFFIFLSLNKVIIAYRSLLIVLGIVALIYSPIGLTYGSPNFNSILSLFYTNEQEASEFISSIPAEHYLFSLLILIFCLLSLKVRMNLYKKINIFLFSFALIMTIHHPLKAFIQGKEFNILDSGLPEIRVVKDVRRDFMNAYGFSVHNTPFMSIANGTLFTNYISAGPSTQISLASSLAMVKNGKDILSNNIVTLAKKAGFYTYWISNQGSMGLFDTPVASMGARADSPLFIKKGESSSGLNRNIPDTNIIPIVKKALEDKKEKKLIVIHLMESHSPACIRTNYEYKVFFKSEQISCYIQSIKNTDDLLSIITSEVQKNEKSWSLMYFADHGVSFFEKDTKKMRLAHNDKYKQNYQVPMFITSYDDTSRKIINAQRNSMSFLTLFSEWTGIQEPTIPRNCKMLSNEICENQDDVLNFSNKIVKYSSLPEDKISK